MDPFPLNLTSKQGQQANGSRRHGSDISNNRSTSSLRTITRNNIIRSRSCREDAGRRRNRMEHNGERQISFSSVRHLVSAANAIRSASQSPSRREQGDERKKKMDSFSSVRNLVSAANAIRSASQSPSRREDAGQRRSKVESHGERPISLTTVRNLVSAANAIRAASQSPSRREGMEQQRPQRQEQALRPEPSLLSLGKRPCKIKTQKEEPIFRRLDSIERVPSNRNNSNQGSIDGAARLAVIQYDDSTELNLIESNSQSLTSLCYLHHHDGCGTTASTNNNDNQGDKNIQDVDGEDEKHALLKNACRRRRRRRRPHSSTAVPSKRRGSGLCKTLENAVKSHQQKNTGNGDDNGGCSHELLVGFTPRAA